MSAVLEFACRLSSEICCKCGMQFAMPEDTQRRRREDHASFFCPAGHPQQYTGATDAEKLERRLMAKEQELQRTQEREASLRKQRNHLEHQLNGTKGALTKVKKRVGAGACPCCNRFFSVLSSHMKTKHPTWKAEQP